MPSKMPKPGDLEPIEKASRDEIAALQLQRLKWSLKHAYDNVPHYRKKFDAAGVKPEDLKQLSDLAKFPFTTKQDLRENYPFSMFAVPREKVVRIHASSGTTGKPTVVGYTKKDIDDWANLMARSIRGSGGRPATCTFATVRAVHGGSAPIRRRRSAARSFRLGARREAGATDPRLQADIILARVHSLAIADEFERQGHDPAKSSLKIGIFGAEPWTNQMRVEIEKRLGIDAVDIYGLSEVMGPGVANECIETKDGLVLWEDYFYPEIIDPVTGEVQPDGASGELVFTSLAKEALPIIRYRTRDLTRLLPPTARSFRRMDKITGRSDDMLIIRGVNVFPSQIEELILKMPKLAPHYVLEVSRPEHMDELDVLVEMKPEFAQAPASDQQAAAKELQHHIKSYIGVSTQVRVVGQSTIERSIGKAKRVIDKRPK